MSLLRAALRSRVGAVLAAAALALPSIAWSQSPPRPAPGGTRAAPGTTAPELNPDARIQRPVGRRSQDLFTPEPPGPCPLADSDVQVTLNAVTFRGVTALTAEELRPAYAAELGSPRPVAVICAIRDRVARQLFDRGVLARVDIPEQRITSGALTLEVIEAHVVNVRVRGDVGPAQAAVERYVERLRGMAPFDMRKAQRYLLLAGDTPGIDVRAAIRPSTSSEKGAVDIDVTVTRRDWQAIANVENLGSKTTGRWGGLIRGELDSQTSFGEQTALTGFRTLPDNEQWLLQATEAFRIGSDGWTARGALTYGESHPGDVLSDLELKSESFVGTAEVAYPLLRTRARNLNLAGGVDVIDQQNDLAGAPLSRDHLRVLYARAEGDGRTEWLGAPTLLTGALTVRKGLSGLGASGSDDTTSRAGAKADAWLVRASGSAETAITDRLVGALRVQAQYARRPLLPYEQMALGSLTVGRGYEPAAVLGDAGVAGTAELRYGALPLHALLLATPYAFVDSGWVRNHDAAASGLDRSKSLTSVGGGVLFRIANRANLDVTVAQALDATTPAGGKDTRVLVQLTVALR